MMAETTITIGKHELRIEYDGSMVDIECVCGVVHEMAENALCFCKTCGANWETRTSIGELVLPDYTEVCFYRLMVIHSTSDGVISC